MTEQNMWGRLFVQVEGSTMTKTAQFMMENGLRIREPALERCYSRTVQSMMVNGMLTKSTDEEYIYLATETDTKAFLITV